MGYSVSHPEQRGYSPFHHEQIVLGYALTFGREAVGHVLDFLRHDRFIYSKESQPGKPDHMRIWQAIGETFRDKMEITPSTVYGRLRSDSKTLGYLKSLQSLLTNYYMITELDPRHLRGMASAVDKAGVVYAYCGRARGLGEIIKEDEDFQRYIGKIEDVDAWVVDQQLKFGKVLSPKLEGYVHISEGIPEVTEYLDRLQSGEQIGLLPTGIPALRGARLIPSGKLVVIHGKSSGGKSTFVRYLNLGTAIGLKENNVPGCVAINTLEETQQELILSMASFNAGVNLMGIETGLTPPENEDWDRLRGSLDYVSELPIFIDDTNLIRVSALDFRFNKLHIGPHGPIHQFSVDFAELMDRNEFDTDNTAYQLQYLTRNLFQITRLTGATCLEVSQSTSFDRHMIAGPTGIRGSQGIYHAADVVLEVHNPPALHSQGIAFEPRQGISRNAVTILVQKYRRGQTGLFELGWLPTAGPQMVDRGLLREGEGYLFNHGINELETYIDDKVYEEENESVVGVF